MADTYGTPLTDTSSGCESALKAKVERAKLYYTCIHTSGTHTYIQHSQNLVLVKHQAKHQVPIKQCIFLNNYDCSCPRAALVHTATSKCRSLPVIYHW
jgi:hypothetical protein